MIKMVHRANRTIYVEQKSQKKKCQTHIQTHKVVSIKLYFSMSIQWGCACCCNIFALTQIVEICTYLQISKTIFRLSRYQLVEVWKI